MDSSNFAPILLFVYNRTHHTKTCLDSLSACPEASASILYIYQDGLSQNSSPQKVQEWKEVQEIIKAENRFKEIHIITRSENFGCNKNMLDGITEVVKTHGQVIVVEDDLIVSNKFLEFLNYSLKKFKNSNVGCINAFNYKMNGLPEYFFIKGANPMGWATWKEKWAFYNYNTTELIEQLTKRADKEDWNFGRGWEIIRNHHKSMLNGGKDVVWSTSLFVNDQLCLWPSKSFVFHAGYDGSGTHTKNIGKDSLVNMSQYSVEELQDQINYSYLENIPLKIDRKALLKLRHFYFKLNNLPFTTKEKVIAKYYLLKHFIKTKIFRLA